MDKILDRGKKVLRKLYESWKKFVRKLKEVGKKIIRKLYKSWMKVKMLERTCENV